MHQPPELQAKPTPARTIKNMTTHPARDTHKDVVTTAHPNCTNGHICQQLSGKKCLTCNQPAGTIWGPYFCPDCDKKRLDQLREKYPK